MFRKYPTESNIHMAHQITDEDEIQEVGDKHNIYLINMKDQHGAVEFESGAVPKKGDYIVYLPNDKVYYCTTALDAPRLRV